MKTKAHEKLYDLLREVQFAKFASLLYVRYLYPSRRVPSAPPRLAKESVRWAVSKCIRRLPLTEKRAPKYSLCGSVFAGLSFCLQAKRPAIVVQQLPERKDPVFSAIVVQQLPKRQTRKAVYISRLLARNRSAWIILLYAKIDFLKDIKTGWVGGFCKRRICILKYT